MLAHDFFGRLVGATKGNIITLTDVFPPSGDRRQVLAFFRYDWTVNDGTPITFNVMSLFEIQPGTDKVGAVTLIHNTHLIGQTAGNKYES